MDAVKSKRTCCKLRHMKEELRFKVWWHEAGKGRDLYARKEWGKGEKRGEEGQGRAETCVIVLPQSFDPGCCSCCYLEHLCLIRGKWVVRDPPFHPDLSLSLLFSLFCILIHSLDFCPFYISSSVLINHVPFNSSSLNTNSLKEQHTRPKLLRLLTESVSTVWDYTEGRNGLFQICSHSR